MKNTIIEKTKKFDWLLQISLLILLLYFIYIYAFSTNTSVFKENFLQQISRIESFHSLYPYTAIALILSAHLVVSFFGIPACSLINIASGYLLGFWSGSFFIYIITMFSAVLGYFSGRYFYNKIGRKSFWRELPEAIKNIEYRGIIYLILLRLSPILPFGLLNLSMGYSKIPFRAYFLSTFTGVFFDVVLLNKIGASIRDLKETTLDDYFLITGTFVILLFILLIFSKKIGQLANQSTENLKS